MSRWKRHRGAVLLVVLLVVVPAAAVALTATRGTTRALDPASPTASGTRALAEVLAAQGVPVTRVERVAQARRVLGRAARATQGQDATGEDVALRTARPGDAAGQEAVARRDVAARRATARDAAARPAAATLVVTDAGLLGTSRLRSLAAGAARTVLLAPDSAAVRALAPGLRAGAARDDGSAAAGCSDADARAAGRVVVGGSSLRDAAGLRRNGDGGASGGSTSVCFAGTYARVVGSGRTTVVLTSPGVVENSSLASRGDAALALRALGAQPRVVWLVASPLDAPAGRARSPFALLPAWVGVATAQLLLVALAAALWRGRRLGALVVEPLPVVVRAAETAEGRAALYRAAASPADSAAALRAGARWRTAARLGLPPGTSAEVVAGAAAQQLAGAPGGRGSPAEPDARAVLLGPAPTDGPGLLALVADLDRLDAALDAAATARPAPTPTGSTS